MAQCQAEGRKHPSAMDMYVGIFHSKLQSATVEVDKCQQQWSRYGYGDQSGVNPSQEKVRNKISLQPKEDESTFYYPENNINRHRKSSSPSSSSSSSSSSS